MINKISNTCYESFQAAVEEAMAKKTDLFGIVDITLLDKEADQAYEGEALVNMYFTSDKLEGEEEINFEWEYERDTDVYKAYALTTGDNIDRGDELSEMQGKVQPYIMYQPTAMQYFIVGDESEIRKEFLEGGHEMAPEINDIKPLYEQSLENLFDEWETGEFKSLNDCPSYSEASTYRKTIKMMNYFINHKARSGPSLKECIESHILRTRNAHVDWMKQNKKPTQGDV